MKSVDPYLNFGGNTLEAFEFYRSVFGGDFGNVMKFEEMGGEVSAENRDRIAHVSLEIVSGTYLMGSDVPYEDEKDFEVGTNFYINLNPDDPEEAQRIFDALSSGGEVEMELAKTGWADLYASFFDKFGVGWMINYNA